jgi:hypothetical protein
MHGLSDQICRRSQLTFISAASSAEPFDFRHLMRVRNPVSRSKSGVQGKVADVVSGRSRHAESLNELNGYRILLATSRADHWLEQPFLLQYHSEGVKHRYTPDVLVVWGTHQEVIEIKDDAEADLPENRERFALIRELLAEHGYCFRVWRKSEIFAEPRLANVGLLLRYRCVSVSAMEQENIRRVLTSVSELDLRAFKTQGIAVQSVLRMVLDGMLHINWWDPITPDSRIAKMPVGPQVWPSPPGGATQNAQRSDDAVIHI